MVVVVAEEILADFGVVENEICVARVDDLSAGSEFFDEIYRH